MKKSDQEWQEAYIDSQTGCLKNLLDIKDQEYLSWTEATFATVREWELGRNPIHKNFDLEHLKAIHKHLFQDVYEWAGQIRTVEISKITGFLPCSLIEKGSEYTFNKLKQENYLKGLDADSFSKSAGYYLGEINHIHPFREGNGRTQRVFINQLAYHNGYYVEWKNINQKQMIEASIEADRDQPKALIELIRQNLVDRDYYLALAKCNSKGITEIKQAEQGQKYHGSIIGITDRSVIQLLSKKPHELIVHQRYNLSKDIMTMLDKPIEIRYPYDKIGLIYETETQQEQTFDYNKEQENQKGDLSEYER